VVLVRPDHHVAWRFATSSPDASALLQKAFSVVLSK
jgi:hypothetical protein